MTKTRLEQAQELAALGLTIFILNPGSKSPLNGHSWYVRNTTDPAVVAEWFSEDEDCNYAVYPGRNFVVLDLDRKPSVDGIEAFEKLCKEQGIDNWQLEIDTMVVKTANGGVHLYFKTPFPVANKTDLPAGIDVRGAIGYVCGPGCRVTPEYEWSTGEYENADPSAKIAPLPEWLIPYLYEPGQKDPRREEPLCEWDLPESIAQAREWLKHQPPAIERQHGDDHTYWTVCALRDFAVSESEIFHLLNEGGDKSWNARCQPPWADNELEVKIENSFEYANNRPGVKSLAYLKDRLQSVRPVGGYRITDAQAAELRRTPPHHEPSITVDGNVVRVAEWEEREGIPIAEEDEDEGHVACAVIRLSASDLIENVRDLDTALTFSEAPLFERGGSVVSLTRIGETEINKDGIRREVGSYVIDRVNPQVMQYMAMRAASFWKWNERKKGWVQTECPTNVVNQYLMNHHVRTLRPLHGIAQSPTLRPDGSVLQENGYDRYSAMFVELRGEFPWVPENPARGEAESALAKLRHVVRGVMFDGKNSRSDPAPTAAESVWLAAVLTSVVRGAIPTAPLFGFSAPVKGSGKTLAADLVGIISTGNDVPAMSIPDGEEELRKTLFASLLKGDGVMLLDNVKAGVPLKSDALNAVLTKSSYEGRVLGASQIITVPVATTFLATGNNFAVDQDLQRRTLLCFIDPRMERPDQRRYDWDARVETRDNRGVLVSAALTIIRAYLTADPEGAVRDDMVPYGSFEDWDRLVRAPLVWLGLPDPVETRKLVAAGSDTDRLETALVDAWTDLFDNSFVRVRDVVAACTTFAGSDHGPDTDDLKEKKSALREILEEICADPRGRINKHVIDKRALGIWLRDRHLRVIAGRRVEKLDTGKVPVWRMASLDDKGASIE